MTKTIRKIGNSHGIIFDVALIDLAHLTVGDQVVVTVHEGGTITLDAGASRYRRRECSGDGEALDRQE